ncbi:hypothetical protein BD626DRAFT_474286 [Schizophyllum amplum]|uniref:Uncharacterized protein n=1 Tax=Schizophyllum amplum TaxID=97359 RepID=A0A550CXG7_9AGAR|nr:hypothetical protein BD626DRAFT_474286 [Auriculariopsis ampla]
MALSSTGPYPSEADRAAAQRPAFNLTFYVCATGSFAAMVARKRPRSNWKIKGCPELSAFDISFSVKEYLQNQVGQVLKECDVYSWNDWEHRDLLNASQQERLACKKELIDYYPGLLTGPHGASLRRPAWLPVYVLSATIDRENLAKTPYNDELEICTVVWNAKISQPEEDDATIMGLTFFNNHLDQYADFDTFVDDGASTSRSTIAVGEKGKGFLLATQSLCELVERHCNDLETKPLKTGVSFRVGHHVGELAWRKRRAKAGIIQPPLLQVVEDDLEPRTAHELVMHWGEDEDGDNDGSTSQPVTAAQLAAAEKAVLAAHKRRLTQNLASKKSGAPGKTTGPDDEESNVSADEVCITVLGLPVLSPEDVFSAIYGIIARPQEWVVTDAITFFKASRGQSFFYHRDQLVPQASASPRLSINYSGPLDISSDRTDINTKGSRFRKYRKALAEAANIALGTQPELAKEIALDIFQDSAKPALDGNTIGRTLSACLQSSVCDSAAYREAFIAAWHDEHPDLPEGIEVYPHLKDSVDERNLIHDLDMHPIIVSTYVHEILRGSGAYTNVHTYATRRLLAAPLVQRHVAGFIELRRGIRHVFPDLEDAQITLREYQHRYPRVLWHADSDSFIFALPPKCSSHPQGNCVCFVGPYLSAASINRRTKEKEIRRANDADGDEGDEVEIDDVPGVFQAFMHAFNMQSADFDRANCGKDAGPQNPVTYLCRCP